MKPCVFEEYSHHFVEFEGAQRCECCGEYWDDLVEPVDKNGVTDEDVACCQECQAHLDRSPETNVALMRIVHAVFWHTSS